MSEPPDLQIDPERLLRTDLPRTSIVVRARGTIHWGDYDIALLDRASLQSWLRQGSQPHMRAEAVVLQLLDHDP